MTGRLPPAIAGLGGLAALLLVVLLTAGGAGVVGASHANSTELANQTVTVTNDSTAVWVEVTNTSFNGTVHNVTATFYGVDGNGTETQVDSAVLSAGVNATDYYEATADPTNYSTYRVVVTGETVESVTTGSIEKVAGGGGTSSSGLNLFGIPWYLWLVVAVVGVLLLAPAPEG